MADGDSVIKRSKMQAAVQTVTRVVQDKVSPGSNNQAMMMNCEAPVNAMDMNKDMNQVVIAGRQVFKIIAIEEDRFSEIANLRVSKPKNMNLNYAATDVAWNHIDEQLLASAATNGAVVIWNLGKMVKSKQDFVSMEHKRTVNRVIFHSGEANQLLSGSQDGTVKLHDLRRRQVTLTFKGSSTESIRDVQFCPPSLGYFNFAAASEGGIVQIWDMRRPDRWEKHFAAHNEPVFAIDWHPEEKNWLMTAGRDKLIKVWDVGKPQAQLLHTISTMSSVGRVKWRPQRKFHIANCQMLVDHSINVYDIRRPFVPFACFAGHKDISTCVRWKDPHTILSTGKDSLLIQHVFQDALRPADSAVPSGVGISIDGDIGFAYKEKNIAMRNKESLSKMSVFGRKASQSRSELFFMEANSCLTIFRQVSGPAELDPLAAQSPLIVMDEARLVGELVRELTMIPFLEMASSYRLKGGSLEELCHHNAGVASSAGSEEVARMWLTMISFFCINFKAATANKMSTLQVSKMGSSGPVSSMDKADSEKSKCVSIPDNEDVVRSDNDKGKVKDKAEASTGTEEDSSGESSEYEKSLANIASGQGHGEPDFFFGDGIGGTEQLTYSDNFNVRNSEDWIQLPTEAFQPRHELTDPTAPPDRPDHDTALMTLHSEVALVLTPVPDSNNEPEDDLLNINIDPKHLHTGPSLDFAANAVEIINYLADQTHVQTAVTMLIVLGDQVRSKIDVETQENWFLAYIDLLSRFQLWTIANEVISLSQLPQVSQLNQESTTIRTECPSCSRVLELSGWWCQKCHKVTNLCGICNNQVKGVSAWCQGCEHGGHINHMMEWFKSNQLCPTGCGHQCQFT